jgi:transposase
MRQREFKLNTDQANELLSAFQHGMDVKAKTRYQAVRLYGLGYRVSEIETICGCSRPSLMEWCRVYRREGVAGLLDHRQDGNHALLRPVEIEELQELMHQYTPAQLLGVGQATGEGAFWSVPDLAQVVKQRYGVVYQSATSYRALLAKCGFSLQRPGHFYQSRHEEQVMAFAEEFEKNCST